MPPHNLLEGVSFVTVVLCLAIAATFAPAKKGDVSPKDEPTAVEAAPGSAESQPAPPPPPPAVEAPEPSDQVTVDAIAEEVEAAKAEIEEVKRLVRERVAKEGPDRERH